MSGQAEVETACDVCGMMMMSCLPSGDAGDLDLRLKQELTKLGWLNSPTRSYYFARRAQRRGASSDRAAASTRLSVQVYIQSLSANAAAGREAEEMFKTGCQCVSVSVTWPSSEHSIFPRDAHKTCLGRRTFTSTSSLLADITLTVDGKEVTVPQGINYGSLRSPDLH